MRLLDAFVWSHAGSFLLSAAVTPLNPDMSPFAISQNHSPTSKVCLRRIGAKYAGTDTGTSGMNVLAAPFLYVLPSQIEAFYCFSRFIEECCPLYVSPTLVGVHRGLKVCSGNAGGPGSADGLTT